MTQETIIFGAGCFWGVEFRFRQIPGVLDAAVGYAGGVTENPTYEQVCTDRTGHAEVVKITYDPAIVTADALCDAFYAMHNPTTINRQGWDIGSQYRSVIFTSNDAQYQTALAATTRAQSGQKNPIVTQIIPAPIFWRGEEYHQQYMAKRGKTIACH